MKNSISRVYFSLGRYQWLELKHCSLFAPPGPNRTEIDSTSPAQRQTMELFHGFNAFSLSRRRSRRRESVPSNARRVNTKTGGHNFELESTRSTRSTRFIFRSEILIKGDRACAHKRWGRSGNSQRNYLSLSPSLSPLFVLLANELSYLSFTTFVTGAIETGFPRSPRLRSLHDIVHVSADAFCQRLSDTTVSKLGRLSREKRKNVPRSPR